MDNTKMAVALMCKVTKAIAPLTHCLEILYSSRTVGLLYVILQSGTGVPNNDMHKHNTPFCYPDEGGSICLRKISTLCQTIRRHDLQLSSHCKRLTV